MSANEKFILDFVTRGVENIDNANAKIQNLNSKINNLSTALLGVSFAGFISGALQAADKLVDFSDATNISIASLKALQASMDIAGGSGKNLEKSINTLFAAIDAANGGSQAARDAFAAVGVSLNDLKNASEADILQKTLEGLSKMPVGAERAAIATQLLSRSMRSVDPKALLESLDPEKYRASEQAAKEAAARIGQIEEAYRNLQEGALRAMEPILKMMGEQNLTVEAGTKIVQGLAIAFGVMFGAQAIASVAGMIAALANFNKALGVTAGLSNLIGKTPLGLILKIGATTTAGAGIALAIDDLISKNEELARSANTAATAQAGVTGAPAPSAGGGKITQATPTTGSANRAQELGPRERAILESNRRIAQSKIEVDKLTALKGADDIKKIELERDAEIAKAKEEINGKENLSRIQKDKEIAAKRLEIETKAALEIARVRQDQQAQLLQQTQNYGDQLASLLGYEKTELQKINDEIARQPEKYKEIGDELRKNAEEQDRNLRIIKEYNKEQERQKTLFRDAVESGSSFAVRLSEMTIEMQRQLDLLRASSEQERFAINERANLEQRMAQFVKANYNEKLAAAELADREGDATAEQIQLITDFLQKKQEQRNFEEQLMQIRLTDFAKLQEIITSLDFVIEDSFKKYKESAMDTSKQVRDSFDNFTQGMEDALVQFALTGKLSFKDMAQSILADLARIAAKRAIVFFASKLLPGLAEGGPTMPNQPYIVGEAGPELFVPKTAGTVIPNSQITSGGDAIGMGSTTVNYNINAVDAASFRSLVARDPSFIYAVTEQGRRSQPVRSR